MGVTRALAVFLVVLASATVVGIHIKKQSAEALFRRAKEALDKGQHSTAEKLCGKVALKPDVDPALLDSALEMAAYCRVMMADTKIMKPWTEIIRLADGFLKLYTTSEHCAQVKAAMQGAMLGKATEQFSKALRDTTLDEPAKVGRFKKLMADLDGALKVQPDGAGVANIDGLKSKMQTEVERLERLIAYRRARGEFQARAAELRKGGHYAQAYRDYMGFEGEYPEAKDDKGVQTYLEELGKEEREAVAFHESAAPASQAPTGWRPSFEKQFWLVAHEPVPHSRPMDAEGAVFCMAKGVLYALDAATGAVRWVRPGNSAKGFLPACPVKHDDGERVVVASDMEDALLLLDASTGAEVWRQRLEDECVGPPMVLGPRVYLATLGRGVLVFSLEKGTFLGHYPMADGILVQPYPDPENQRLLVASENGQVYELDLASGKCKEIVRTGLPRYSIGCRPLAISIYLLLSSQQGCGPARLHVYARPKWVRRYEPAKSPVQDVSEGIVGELHLATPSLYAYYADGYFRALKWNSTDPEEGVVLNESINLASREALRTNAQFIVADQGGDRILLLAIGDSLKAYNLGTGEDPVPATDDTKTADGTQPAGLWRKSLSPGAPARVAFPLQRRGSVVYAGYEGIESDGTVLLAYDFRADKGLWRVATGMEPTDLVLQNDTGYVRTTDGSVFELDLASRAAAVGGRLVSRGVGNFSRWVPRPLIRKVGGKRTLYLGGKSTLAAIEPGGGEPRSVWANDCVGQGFVTGPPVWLDGRLILATDAGKVYAVDAATGKPNCEEFVSGPPPAPFHCGPAIGPKDGVFIGADNGILYRLKIEQRAGLACLRAAAKFDTKGKVRARPTFAHGFGIDVVYVGNMAGHVWACSTRDLKELGHWQVQGRVCSEVVVWGKRLLLVTTDEGSVYALRGDAKETIEWRFPKAGERIGPVLGAPALSYNTVYVGSADGHIYGIEAATGERVWKHRIGYPIHRTPIVHKSRLIVAAASGQIFVVRPGHRRGWQ